MATKTWIRTYSIPQYLVQEFGDNGIVEMYDENNNKVDCDDLRISLTLSSGLKVLLNGHNRLVLDKDFCHIEELVESKD